MSTANFLTAGFVALCLASCPAWISAALAVAANERICASVQSFFGVATAPADAVVSIAGAAVVSLTATSPFLAQAPRTVQATTVEAMVKREKERFMSSSI